MAVHNETFVVTVLPLTTRADAKFHLSLHIAPRLTPDGAEEPLGHFAAFRNWASTVAGASLSLRSGTGSVAIIAATPRFDRIDPELWLRVFPENTPVRAPQFDSLAGRQWLSFPVKTVHDLAIAAPLLTTLLFPTNPPTLPRGRPRPRWSEGGLNQTDAQVMKAIGALSSYKQGDHQASIGDPDEDERLLTDKLDKGTLGSNPWAPILKPLHAARRFYARPEAARTYHARPLDGVARPMLGRPTPDFHERVAHLADQPELLRRLGLVIDVHVEDLALLKSATELHAILEQTGLAAAPISARTPVVHDRSRLLTTPRTGDWESGRLKLGDSTRYSTLAMDSDGGALKLENFVRSLPRHLGVAQNGDPGNVAPPALRSEGFTVVMAGRAGTVREQVEAAIVSAKIASNIKPPVIATEDVTRGFRVQVWDNHEKVWFSPHARLATARLIKESAPIYKDLPELGCVQTAAVGETPDVTNGPLYLHEALFGWSGWSLSAPRPGPRTIPDEALPEREAVAEADPQPDDPVTPVLVDTVVQPNTLPRLRYGRSYAFRAWSVDLAGNSPGDPVQTVGSNDGGGPPFAAQPIEPAVAPVSDMLESRPPTTLANRFPELHRAATTLASQRAAARPDESIQALDRTMMARSAVAAFNTPRLTGVVAVDQLIAGRLLASANREASAPTATVGAELLAQSIQEIALEPHTAPRADLLSAVAAADVAAGVETDKLPAFGLAGKTITPLTPFLRWDPVPPPVVVARRRFTTAESAHHLVIRSGVAATASDDDGDQATVVPPAAWIAQIQAANPAAAADWRATSERHLAAPNGSQRLNELHGRFDGMIGGDAATGKRLLAAALREDGTLFDTQLVNLDDPSGAPVLQPGVSLQAGPEIATPETDLSKFEGRNRGNPIPAGHYVIHDVDTLALPYLPDPLAAGVAMGMSEANRGSPLLWAFAVESTAARFGGEWPAPECFRLVLESGPQARTSIDGNVITVALPPGERLEMRLSSSLRREDLKLFALWNLIPSKLRALDLIERPAADGQFWAMTPFLTISLVHAVPRPVLPPITASLVALRALDATSAGLVGVIDCHAPSTDQLDAEASWDEWVDDLAAPGPVREARHAAPFHLQVEPDENMVVLAGELKDEFDGKDDGVVRVDWSGIGLGPVRIHRAVHQFGDTRHRVVDYRFRATTRFREYFDPTLLPTPESRSLMGAPRRLSLPATARPPAPVVDSVIPIFRWDATGDPGQPFGVRRRRRSGLRVYLQRPWYRSGDDEQLAVVIGNPTSDAAHTSMWGADPVWLNAGPATRLVGLSVEDVYGAVGLDKVRGPDSRLSPPAFADLPVPGKPPLPVSIIGYHPEYNADRRLWFVDVAIEPAAAVWPFVRLAVARYQPNSLAGLELSTAVLCDFAQLPPERAMTMSRPDEGSVRVTVTGPIGLREGFVHNAFGALGAINEAAEPASTEASPYPFGTADATNLVARNRRMWAMIERRDAAHNSDLDWRVVRRQELSLGGVSATTGEWAWTGVIDIGQSVRAADPGANHEWRVTVEEHEGLEGDPADLDKGAPLIKEWRIIYADRTPL